MELILKNDYPVEKKEITPENEKYYLYAKDRIEDIVSKLRSDDEFCVIDDAFRSFIEPDSFKFLEAYVEYMQNHKYKDQIMQLRKYIIFISTYDEVFPLIPIEVQPIEYK